MAPARSFSFYPLNLKLYTLSFILQPSHFILLWVFSCPKCLLEKNSPYGSYPRETCATASA